MRAHERNKIAGLLLATIGVGLVVIGLIKGDITSVVAGAGFFITTWAFMAPEEK